MAEVPADTPFQKASVPLPKALTTPVPVTTTRFTLLCWRSFGLRIDELGNAIHHLVDVLDLLGVFVVDLDVELAFEIEEDVEAVERVNTEGLKAAVGCNGLERNTFGGRDDFQNSILDGWGRQGTD